MTPGTGTLERNTRLTGQWLLIARIAWVFTALLILSVFVLALPVNMDELRYDPYQFRSILGQLGLSMDFLVFYVAILVSLLVLACLAVAVIIFLRKSDDWFGLFASLALLFLIPLLPVISSLGNAYPAWILPLNIFRASGGLVLLLVFYLFPDGRFVPSWTKILMGFWFVFAVVLVTIPGFSPPAAPIDLKTWQQVGDLFFLLVIMATGAFAQIYRYKRVMTAVQRQQAKWVVFGLTAVFAGLALSSLPAALFPVLRTPGVSSFIYVMIDVPVSLLSLFVLPLSLAIAILKYRLWDIDILIRRTLVYGALTISLAVVYFSGVLLLQEFFQVITGQNQYQSPIALVVSTLMIVAISNPLLRRIQTNIDRRFYRQKYDADKMLQSFARFARDEVDLDKLTKQLVWVVEETLQPESLSLWMSQPSGNTERFFEPIELRDVNGN